MISIRNRRKQPGEIRYRAEELAKLLGTTTRRIEGWVEQGLLKPTFPGRRGPGQPHEFDLSDLFTAAILIELQRAHGEKSPVVREFIGSKQVNRVLHEIADSQNDSSKPSVLALLRPKEGDVRGLLIAGDDLSELYEVVKTEGATATLVKVDVIGEQREKLRQQRER